MWTTSEENDVEVESKDPQAQTTEAPSEFELISQEIESATQVLRAAEAEAAAAKDLVRTAQAELDQLIVQRDRLKAAGRSGPNKDIVAYLESQKRLREKRASDMQELRERGFDLGPAKSRLDQVMVRRVGYGNSRPRHPLIGPGTKG